MARFGPEFKQYYAKTLDFHLEGDVGIGDLVYANTYWAQDDTWVNEYSEYMQYVNTGPPNNYTAVNRQGFTCQTGPIGRRSRQVTGRALQRLRHADPVVQLHLENLPLVE